jgi:DNA-binding response OmpR family regulator
MSHRVLIVEDDGAMARLLRDNLEYDGFQVEWAGDGNQALAKFQAFSPDLVLLDLTLPGRDGFTVCEALCARPVRPPIIILSARSQKDDKVRSLNLGADDYVTKPFALEELLARVHAVLRRSRNQKGAAPQNQPLALGDTVVDFDNLRASRAGKELNLTHRELQVLQYLAERAGRLVTRDELLREIWGHREALLTRSVDLTIARLRRKIELDPRHPRFIRTLHGDGYTLTPEA